MSSIDQAFIRAFGDGPGREQPVAVPRTPAPDFQTPPPQAVPDPHCPVADAAPEPCGTYSTDTADGAVTWQPLSTYVAAAAAQQHAGHFRAELEVDAFLWPPVIDALTRSHADLFTGILSIVLRDTRRSKVFAFVGDGPGAGCSTVAASVARLLGAQGLRVALVDSDFQKHDLAFRLGVAVDYGWETALAGERPLTECAVRSKEDNITLVPLGSGAPVGLSLLDGLQTSVLAGVIRQAFDVTIFDLGRPLEQRYGTLAQVTAVRAGIDSCIAVTATDAAAAPLGQRMADRLQIPCAGVVRVDALGRNPAAPDAAPNYYF